jgi:hypothetical protein
MTKEVLKLALEALATLHDENIDYLVRNKLGGENNQCLVFAREAITAIKEALTQHTWVGLTDDEVYRIAFELEGEHWRKIADAIEAKLKAKNT